MKTTIEKHNEAIKTKNYNGVITEFNGYIQFGKIKDCGHNLIGFPVDSIKRCVEIINNPNYLYARQKNGYINIYGKSNNSPTGVELLGGIPNELEFLLYALGKTGQLSETEELRTAR